MHSRKVQLDCSQLSKSHSICTYISEIDFSSAKNKMRTIDATINCPNPVSQVSTSTKPQRWRQQTQHQSNIDLKSFYRELSKCGYKPAILSLVSEHAHNHIPKSSSPNYPKPLQSLYDQKFLKLEYTDLLSACSEVDIHVNADMVSAVESATRDQSKSKLWFKYRAGRITASKMKSACKTDPGLPSQSLIKTICYPEAFGFTTRATRWGCEHEKTAIDYYGKACKEKHDDFELNKSGLFLNTDWPFIGASPDGLINCSCCGKGAVEIKCSYCHRFETVDKVASDRQSCLVRGSDGILHLSTSHAYYYQVQTQIHICKVDYCDFCMCTFPDNGDHQPSLHIERIFPDDEFWQTCVDLSQHFFNICILPELLGRWYSRSHSSVASSSKTMSISEPMCGASSTMTSMPSTTSICDSDQSLLIGETSMLSASISNKLPDGTVQLYCYCKKPDDPTLDWIGCDNPTCDIEWFHVQCLKMKSIPKRQWYCPDCRKLPEFNKSKKLKLHYAVED